MDQQPNDQAPEEIRSELESHHAPLKILLLGAGETGKTTLFKQIGTLYGLNPLLQNGDDVRKVIRKNIIESITILAKHADLLDDTLETKITSQTANAAETDTCLEEIFLQMLETLLEISQA